MCNVCAIGHVTRDIIKVNERKKELSGGTPYYFSMALKALGLNVSVVTKIGCNDRHLLDDLNKNGIPIFLSIDHRTTIFENSYIKEANLRVQKVRSIASPFTIEDIPDISPDIFHVGPLTKGDIPLDVLDFLSKKSRISLDVQGFVRRVERDRIKTEDWEEKKEGLSYVDILKADETEAKILSGERDIERAAEELSARGPKEVIITLGSKGSLIYFEEEFYNIPSFPQRMIIDPTGCGDTYMAGYIYMRLSSHDFNESGKFSAAIASLKLKNHGPFRGSKKDILDFLAEGVI